MKKIITILLAFAMFFTFVGCNQQTNPVQPPVTGDNAIIEVPPIGFKITLPSNNPNRAGYYSQEDVSFYIVELTQGEEELESLEGKPSETLTFTVEEEGTYTISVYAYNAEGTLIAEGSVSKEINFDDGYVSVVISLIPKIKPDDFIDPSPSSVQIGVNIQWIQPEENNDPFANIESTLTVPVENLDDIDFTGTWDFMQIRIASDPEIKALKQTEKGYITVEEDKVTQTFTYIDVFWIFVSEEEYIEMKSDTEDEPENYYQSYSFDDEKLTISAIAGKGVLDDFNEDDIPLETFLDNLTQESLSLALADSVTTNESKTSFKADFGDNGYYIYIKR